MIQNQYFASAVRLDMHPMKNSKKKIKEQYFGTLTYFLKQIEVTEHIRNRLIQYREFFGVGNEDAKKEKSYVNNIIVCRFSPWRNKYKFWLICDIALIVVDYEMLNNIVSFMKALVSNRQKKLIDDLLMVLLDNQKEISQRYWVNMENLIVQYRQNKAFFSGKEYKVIVTANMSAGKSTLINAVMGTDLSRTSQEICTENICYFYNKPFNDGRIQIYDDKSEYLADYQSIKAKEWNMPVSIAANFISGLDSNQRICIIDTPGVNSSIKKEHGRIAKKCIREEQYDILLYVLNANKLGTDEEMDYLKWISNNVPKEKVVFVINKLDDFRLVDDNIHKSINRVKNELQLFGYENPVVCPVSAYFAYLLKKKSSGVLLTEDEEDEYELYFKKFSKQGYNLAKYNDSSDDITVDYEGMLKRSGFYYLEKIIYGGAI